MPNWGALLIAVGLVVAIAAINMVGHRWSEARKERKKVRSIQKEESSKYFKALDINV